MSTQNNQTNNTVDNTVNDQQHEEVDYADPESPTLAIRRLASPTTGQTERHTDDFDLADYIDKPLPGMVASPAEEAHKLSLQSATSTRGSDTQNEDEVKVLPLNHPPMKRRRFDLGDLMVKQTGPAKPISASGH